LSISDEVDVLSARLRSEALHDPVVEVRPAIQVNDNQQPSTSRNALRRVPPVQVDAFVEIPALINQDEMEIDMDVQIPPVPTPIESQNSEDSQFSTISVSSSNSVKLRRLPDIQSVLSTQKCVLFVRILMEDNEFPSVLSHKYV
jgi:hypothetical protein